MSKEKLMSLEEIEALDEVKEALKNVLNLNKPKSNIVDYLNHTAYIYDKDTEDLERYLSVYSAWRNYFLQVSMRTLVIKRVAERQAEKYWGKAIIESKGSVNEKKELAKYDDTYNDAKSVANRADILHNSIVVNAENCLQAYNLVSRVLSKRLGLKEY